MHRRASECSMSVGVRRCLADGGRRRRTAAAGRARAASPAPHPAGPDDAGSAGSPRSPESTRPASDGPGSADRPARHTQSRAASAPPSHDYEAAFLQGPQRRCTRSAWAPLRRFQQQTPAGRCPSARRRAAPGRRGRAPSGCGDGAPRRPDAPATPPVRRPGRGPRRAFPARWGGGASSRPSTVGAVPARLYHRVSAAAGPARRAASEPEQKSPLRES